MTNSVESRLQELGITLQDAPEAVGAYVPALIEGPHIYISGQIPLEEGGVKFTGHMSSDLVPSDNSIEVGQAAARLCLLNILMQVKAKIGDLDRLEQCIRLGGFVSCPADFYEHPQVINGASNLMKDILGDKGQHCRSAVGCSSLPLNSLVEIEGLFRFKP